MAPLNPEAAEFSPISISSPPHLLPSVSVSIPTFFSPPPPCFPVLPCMESHPPSLPFMEVCPPQFCIYNNNINLYYASGLPFSDPLLKSPPFHDPSWYSLVAGPAAQEPLPFPLLPQAQVDDASVVEEKKTRGGEAEIVAPRRAVGHRAGRKSSRSVQSHWRRIERLQCSEQGKGIQFWRSRRGSGESCGSEQGEEEQKNTTLMIRNIPNKFT